MRTVCIIPARGGSVRIPRKNVKPFHGKPIMLYSIEAAQQSGLFDQVIVSTDDAEISRIARKAGASVFWRHGTDDGTKGTQEVAADVLRETPAAVAPGFACVLYATAPMVTWQDLLNGFQLMLGSGLTYCYPVDEKCCDVGAFYWGAARAFVDGIPLQGNSFRMSMPPERAIDINTPEDWARAESMFDALRRAT